ncbi:hypothetical protein [Streptomyces sp. IMTB 2501]|uniref:hypothetical protein n=1 Tax=Streptomyces sp. IMTB 2501 TaxID=1776340 RepID=UPI0011813BE6|nr:hypothetical protein [Streptomyces sp. IMTB 2501]
MLRRRAVHMCAEVRDGYPNETAALQALAEESAQIKALKKENAELKRIGGLAEAGQVPGEGVVRFCSSTAAGHPRGAGLRVGYRWFRSYVEHTIFAPAANRATAPPPGLPPPTGRH